MKKYVLVLVLLLTLMAGTSYAGGGPNGTYVHFQQGAYDCETYWKMTGSGLVHEWRTECAPHQGTSALHLVFKPYPRFPYADCDDEGFLSSTLWTANLAYYTDYTDDEADLEDFLVNGAQYWVCFYSWE